jgi:hypothetical protein
MANQVPANDLPDSLVPESDLPETLKKPSKAEKEDQSYDMSEYAGRALKEVGRQVGLTARAALTGATAIPGMVADVPFQVANAFGANLSLPSENQQRLMSAAGLPEPKNAQERVVQEAASAVAGAGGSARLANKVAQFAKPGTAQQVIKSLSEDVGRQTLSSGLGAGAAQTAKESDVGPAGQIAAGVAGSLAPSVAPYALKAGVRGTLRGGEQNIPKMRQNIAAFEGAGTTPTVGQASEQPLSRFVESGMAKLPGSANQMAKKAATQAEEIGATVEKLADDLAKGQTADPEAAGRAIAKGLNGPGGFVSRFKEGQKMLYDKLDSYIKPDNKVEVSNTKNALASMNEDIKGAEQLSKFFQNSKIKEIEKALKSDVSGAPETVMVAKQPPKAGGGLMNAPVEQPNLLVKIPEGPPTNALPYEAVKKLRTLVGQQLEDHSLTSDIPRSKWKALYAALSNDLEAAAAATSNPDAVKAMSRANQFTRAGHARIDSVLEEVAGKAKPEDIFQAATSGMKDGATKISSVMKSLNTEERDIVKAAFVDRMGKAAPGAQNAGGDVFSSQTFLTNWNKMSPRAKSIMFASESGTLAKKLDDIATAASNIKEGSKVFANPSGTTAAGAQVAGLTSVVTALASGNLGLASALVAGAGGANLTARLMTNPKFVDWLAKATKMSNAAAPSVLNSLPRMMKDQPIDVQEDAEKYLNSVQAGTPEDLAPRTPTNTSMMGAR